MTERTVCVACRHEIDAAAKLCPYCGADPRSGDKPVDTQTLIEEEFHPRKLTASESVIDFARQRQGVVITIAIVVAIVMLAALHQFVTQRNRTAVSGAPAVALTEVTDLSNQPDEANAQPMPELQFQYDGHPQAMRTFLTEPGAVTPPEVVAAQQQQQPPAQPLAMKPPPQPH
jgi:hypothetical protein